MPAIISSASASPPPMSARTTCALPSVGWPANGISKVGVKMRTRAFAAVDGRMNVVSDTLNCRASACIVAASSPRASSTTTSGLPPRRSSAKTLTIRNAYWAIVNSP
jgi:hypothetical protein